MRRCLQFLLFLWLLSSLQRADGQPFDLSGPKVDVHVKRGDVTLPVSEVANLLPGDRLWVHPDLPPNQSEHFVLVVAFLRGSTNPPPTDWFTRVETWTRDARDEGVFVTVPDQAQQALLFLAPETGGDFNTLRKAVHDQPGSFVRAAQDLQAASWERMRLETYLSDVKVTSQSNPAALQSRAEMAARSLGIKINEACFLKAPDQQVACLSQNSEGMVLNDSNAQSVVNLLAAGSTLDLVNQLSSTPFGGSGVYSPYIGAIVDTARILGSLHTAHFVYIPALALPKTDSLNLRLNMPPSFRNPKSVVVVALPPIGPARPEPLHPVNSEDSFCALKPRLVLPAEGAPLVFATEFANHLALHVTSNLDPKAPAVDVPLVADSSRGGLVPTEAFPPLPAGELTGEVRGKWSFDDWEGPQYRLFAAQPGMWTLDPADQTALVVGRDDALHFQGQSSVCVEKVEAQTHGGHLTPVAWKSSKNDGLDATVPLKKAEPGPVSITIQQYGLNKPDHIALEAYDAEASLVHLTLSSGDRSAMLEGTRLDEVAMARVNGIAFTPSALKHIDNFDQLLLIAAESTSGLEPFKSYEAQVELKDARVLKAPVSVGPPRPQVTLLSKGVQQDGDGTPPPVQLGSPDDLPVEQRLVFFLRSVVPAAFPRTEKVELASEDMGFNTTLTLSDGSLMLANADTAEGSLEPLARFGSSAFGPVRVRAISADGAAGDWLPLGTFVRLPGFKELRCPRAQTKPCVLSGTNLFLAASFSATQAFDVPTDVPPEFTGLQLFVPHPVNGVLYLKLRDDPATVQTLTLPVTPISLAESKAAATETQPSSGSATSSVPAVPASEPATAPATTPAAPQATPPADTKPTDSPAPSSEPAQPPATPTKPAAPSSATHASGTPSSRGSSSDTPASDTPAQNTKAPPG